MTVSSHPSSSGAAACASVLGSLSRHAAVSPSAGTSCRGRSPPTASCQHHSHSRSVSNHRSTPSAHSGSVRKSGAPVQGESCEEASLWLRHSWSPSTASSRGGSASLGSERCSSHSHSPSPSRKVDEDHQEEQFSFDFCVCGGIATFSRQVTGGPVGGT